MRAAPAYAQPPESFEGAGDALTHCADEGSHANPGAQSLEAAQAFAHWPVSSVQRNGVQEAI